MLKTRTYWSEKLTEIKQMIPTIGYGDDIEILKELVVELENNFIQPAKEYISEYDKLYAELEKRGVAKGSTLYTLRGTLCSSMSPIEVKYNNITTDHNLDTLFATKEEAEAAAQRMINILKK